MFFHPPKTNERTAGTWKKYPLVFWEKHRRLNHPIFGFKMWVFREVYFVVGKKFLNPKFKSISFTFSVAKNKNMAAQPPHRKWLGSPPFGRGPTIPRSWGLTITMVANYLDTSHGNEKKSRFSATSTKWLLPQFCRLNRETATCMEDSCGCLFVVV